MIAIRRSVAIVIALVCVVSMHAMTLFAQEPRDPRQQGEFIPLDQLPPTEPFPAAPLLISAYAVVLVVLFLYLVSVARRLTAVQREVERLEADVKRTGRA